MPDSYGLFGIQRFDVIGNGKVIVVIFLWCKWWGFSIERDAPSQVTAEKGPCIIRSLFTDSHRIICGKNKANPIAMMRFCCNECLAIVSALRREGYSIEASSFLHPLIRKMYSRYRGDWTTTSFKHKRQLFKKWKEQSVSKGEEDRERLLDKLGKDMYFD